MAESSRQKRITGRVMHEFKHGELKSGRGGKGGAVKSRRQAIAVALEEAGASKYKSPRRNRRSLRRTENKETKGQTAQQEREGRSRVGAYRKRESTPAMRGVNAKSRRHVVIARPAPARTEPTATPDRNSMKKLGRSTLRAAPE
jgi:hypothetical protein